MGLTLVDPAQYRATFQVLQLRRLSFIGNSFHTLHFVLLGLKPNVWLIRDSLSSHKGAVRQSTVQDALDTPRQPLDEELPVVGRVRLGAEQQYPLLLEIIHVERLQPCDSRFCLLLGHGDVVSGGHT